MSSKYQEAADRQAAATDAEAEEKIGPILEALREANKLADEDRITGKQRIAAHKALVPGPSWGASHKGEEKEPTIRTVRVFAVDSALARD